MERQRVRSGRLYCRNTKCQVLLFCIANRSFWSGLAFSGGDRLRGSDVPPAGSNPPDSALTRAGAPSGQDAIEEASQGKPRVNPGLKFSGPLGPDIQR